MIQNVCRVLIVTDVGTVQCFDHFAVNTARQHSLFLPELHTLFRGAQRRNDCPVLLAELSDIEIG